MDQFLKLENLFLQHNKISEIRGLETLQNLQFLALQNNQIKEIKGIKHLNNLAFLDLSYNKIKEYDEKELPKNLLIFKLLGNPCEKSMVDSRKKAVLHCEILEEMDNIAIHISERMHYQGLVEIDLERQLSELKDRKLEQEMKSKLEDEVMEVSAC
jgi:Leucine-rich repeat (LRR) protein